MYVRAWLVVMVISGLSCQMGCRSDISETKWMCMDEMTDGSEPGDEGEADHESRGLGARMRVT